MSEKIQSVEPNIADLANGWLRKYKLEPKIMRFIYPKIGKEPNLVLIKATKGAKQFLKMEYVVGKNNSYFCITDDIRTFIFSWYRSACCFFGEKISAFLIFRKILAIVSMECFKNDDFR